MEREAGLRARLHALVESGCGVADLAALRDEARAACGTDHELALLIEYRMGVRVCADSAPVDALAIAAALRERAGRALAEQHPTARAIRSHHVGCVARQGHPGDLSRAVALRREEVERALAAAAEPHWTGVAHAELALALHDRGRYGRLDPGLAGHDGDGDLAEAAALIAREVDRRVATVGTDDPFTWHARSVRCGVLVAQARRGDRAAARQAQSLADALLDHEWRLTGAHGPRALAAQRWLAESLFALGRAEAEAEARLGAELATGRRGPELGHALLLLAEILAARRSAEATAVAEAALAARGEWFSPLGHQLAEARLVVASGADRAQGIKIQDRDLPVPRADHTLPA